MVDQTKAAGAIAQKLSNQLLDAQGLAERDGAMKALRDSQQIGHIGDVVDEERLQEKVESVRENERILDQVHISDKAQAMYRAHEAKLDGAPERAHNRRQGEPKETDPKPEQTVLGNLDQQSE